MALTRKMLKAMGIDDEKIDQIIDEHVAVTDALKQERDGYKKDAEKLPGVQKELDDLKDAGDGGYKKKYEDEHKAFEDYKGEVVAKETRATKTAAYRKLLKETGVSDKYIETVIRASSTEIDALEMDGDKVKNAEDLKKTAKSTWADFIPTKGTKGAKVDTPPTEDPGDGDEEDLGQMSMADYIAARKKM